MADSLWAGAVRKGTAANMPSVPDCSSDTVQFYYQTDTKRLFLGLSGGSGWTRVGGHQPAPTAKTGDATLTIAELLTGIVTATKATAVALTLPTGTLTDAGMAGGYLDADQSFDWSVINLGSSSGDVTMTAGTAHTYVGAAVVAVGTSARFRTRKTAANTYVTYRLS